MLFWLSYVPIAALSLFRVIQNRNLFVEKHDSEEKYPKHVHTNVPIVFQITTRSATKTNVVKRGIHSIIDSAKKIGYRNYHISIVTDDPEDVGTLKGMNCEVIV